MERFSKSFGKLAGPVFLFIGVGLFASGLADVNRARRSNSWPATQGVILGSWPGEDSEGFHPKVRYSYKVGGAAYQSKRIRLGSSETSDRSAVEAWMARNKVGANVPVYYEPAHPTEAVLERGIYANTWLNVGIGALFVSVGLFLLRGYWFRSKPRANFTATSPPPL